MRIVIVAVLLFAVICNVIGAKLAKDDSCKQNSVKETEMCNDEKGLMCMAYTGCMYGNCDCPSGKFWHATDAKCKPNVIKTFGEACSAIGQPCESGNYCDTNCKAIVAKAQPCADTSVDTGCETGTLCRKSSGSTPQCREPLAKDAACTTAPTDIGCSAGATCTNSSCACNSGKDWVAAEKICRPSYVFVDKGAVCETSNAADSKVCKTGLTCLTCPNESTKIICVGDKEVAKAKGGAATAEMPARLVFFSSVLLFILNKA